MVNHNKIAQQLAGDFVNEVLSGKSDLLSFCKGAVYTVMTMVADMKTAASEQPTLMPGKQCAEVSVRFLGLGRDGVRAIEMAHDGAGWEGEIKDLRLDPCEGLKWSASFTCGGDSMRAGGTTINGVYFVQWWK